ncbi:MAG: 3-deoxy-manno-octulosonate cytidylyltransferase [Bacteroides sp.]|nr:3-deoxy-manno-octulosonate cytidylyltransferase [Roseburia sp.]MCM1345821.1 3-deoxy-manno-octulosonate cytidylyltransferase [Bacteroides sp.]MCM1421286.1 3-deoxy-manno-octulosonate cytidylyltransferase [Bacteroides sp.]
MKIVCVIPARAESSRFFEKPLAKICGKPMIQWVYSHCKEVREFSAVYVATDSEKIKAACESFGAEVIMTSDKHETATERLYEVSTRIEADLYVMVNGDEPLLTREAIIQCIPSHIANGELYVSNLMTDFSNPVEVVDSTNLKIVTDAHDRCLFISRSPIPYPKGNMDYVYHKFVGVGAFNRKALDFYHHTPRGPIEKIEENDSFRFIENNVPIYYYNCHCKSLSVDTRKDIEGVEQYLKD